MKAFKITLLAALISSPLAAEDIDKTWEVGVFGDYIKSASAKETNVNWQQIEAGKSIGIDLQKIISDQWSARIELARTRYDINNGTDKDYGTRFGIDAIYNIGDTGLYTFAGVKRFLNVDNYNAVNLGAGYSLAVSERFSLYSEAVVYRDVNNGYTDQAIKIGLKYAFGDVKKSPVVNKQVPQEVVAAPVVAKLVAVDTDNDGVIDKFDACNDTPADVKVDSKGCTLYSEKSVEIKLNIAFENNSSIIKPTMVDDVQRLADFMKEYQNTNVVIEGHSSAVGTKKYNLMLSQKRADKVKAVLTDTFNIDANRLSTKGFGETQLLSQDNSNADNILNRRVVAKIETTVSEVIKK